jgi:hypothetical protein
MNNVMRLKLFLFTTQLDLAQEAEKASIDSIVVDWESKGKLERQAKYDTEINNHNPQELEKLTTNLKIPVTVRVNPLGKYTIEEINLALDKGAKSIMLPMAKTPQEVEKFINLVNHRAKTIVQIENQSLVDKCADLNDIAWDCAYIGLNDLMISRSQNWLWEPLLDKTVEQIFTILQNRPVGFGGATVIGGGYPLPFIELLQEMARLGCCLTVVRRSFKKDIVGRNLEAEIEAIRAVWKASCLRDSSAIARDNDKFYARLNEIKKLFHQ